MNCMRWVTYVIGKERYDISLKIFTFKKKKTEPVCWDFFELVLSDILDALTKEETTFLRTFLARIKIKEIFNKNNGKKQENWTLETFFNHPENMFFVC